MKRTTMLVILAAALAAGCAGTGTPPPAAAAAPEGDARYLVDPRVGYDKAASPNTDRAFDAAWRFYLAGDTLNARKRASAILAKEPGYAPASLIDAAIALREGKLDVARAILDKAPHYTASDVYRGELALAEHDLRGAQTIYRALAQEAGAPPFVRERLAGIEKDLFDQVYHQALSAQGDDAVRLLREAIELQPGANAARILLAQRLVALKQYDEAHAALDPVLNTGDVDRADVQEALAEIDAGRGRYQEAIVRYERIARRDPRYQHRLDEIKEQFAAANMPPQYQRAAESEAITRADFAVLLYWKVTSVRFAQNVGSPPIAIDLSEDVVGREEMIRAIALGIFNVDPVTRRVGPYTTLTTSSLARLASRVLLVRGAGCARAVPYERDEPAHSQKVLAACNVPDPLAAAPPDTPASGRVAAGVVEGIDRALSR